MQIGVKERNNDTLTRVKKKRGMHNKSTEKLSAVENSSKFLKLTKISEIFVPFQNCCILNKGNYFKA